MNVNKEDFLFFRDFINAKPKINCNNFIDNKLLKRIKKHLLIKYVMNKIMNL